MAERSPRWFQEIPAKGGALCLVHCTLAQSFYILEPPFSHQPPHTPPRAGVRLRTVRSWRQRSSVDRVVWRRRQGPTFQPLPPLLHPIPCCQFAAAGPCSHQPQSLHPSRLYVNCWTTVPARAAAAAPTCRQVAICTLCHNFS